jgi:hypothetical protein
MIELLSWMVLCVIGLLLLVMVCGLGAAVALWLDELRQDEAQESRKRNRYDPRD